MTGETGSGLTRHHLTHYGGGVPADPERCCISVWGQGEKRPRQCRLRRGYGPDGAYCSLHNPEAVRGRETKAKEDRRARMERVARENRLRAYAPLFCGVLVRIASGEEADPVRAAREILENWGGMDTGTAARVSRGAEREGRR